MLSIVIPIFNAKKFLELTLSSIFANTKNKFELILIDDKSDKETRNYVKRIEAPEVKITKVFNQRQQWINYNWNLGVSLSKGEYIAILNSDIEVAKDWDRYLMDALEGCTISCPREMAKPNLDPVIATVDPHMIKGSCFMFKEENVDKLFPIPSEIKHWCGDNYIADKANKMQGVIFNQKAYIKHYITQSGKTVKKDVYWKRVKEDIDAYEKISGRNMFYLKSRLPFGV